MRGAPGEPTAAGGAGDAATRPDLVVLAAGLGSRFGEGSKPMAAVGPSGETLPDYAIYDAARAGYRDAVLVVRAAEEPAVRDHLEAVVGDAFPVRTVVQDPGPSGFEWAEAVPGALLPEPLPAREKPWGTGAAVLAAEPCVDGPFVVANADDFYGDVAYRQLRDHLAGDGPGEHALVAWRLEDTLEGGELDGFSRAVCRRDGERLERIVEVRDIRRVGEDAWRGSTVEGEAVSLAGDALVSRNLWAFMPSAFGWLGEGMGRFLEAHAGDPETEYLLSDAVGEMLREGEGRVRVHPARQPSFGVTYREEVPRVAARIEARIAEGAYPASLADGFRALTAPDRDA